MIIGLSRTHGQANGENQDISDLQEETHVEFVIRLHTLSNDSSIKVNKLNVTSLVIIEDR